MALAVAAIAGSNASSFASVPAMATMSDTTCAHSSILRPSSATRFDASTVLASSIFSASVIAVALAVASCSCGDGAAGAGVPSSPLPSRFIASAPPRTSDTNVLCATQLSIHLPAIFQILFDVEVGRFSRSGASLGQHLAVGALWDRLDRVRSGFGLDSCMTAGARRASGRVDSRSCGASRRPRALPADSVPVGQFSLPRGFVLLLRRRRRATGDADGSSAEVWRTRRRQRALRRRALFVHDGYRAASRVSRARVRARAFEDSW